LIVNGLLQHWPTLANGLFQHSDDIRHDFIQCSTFVAEHLMWNRQYVIGLSKFEYCGVLFIVIVDMNVYSVIVYFKQRNLTEETAAIK